MVTVWNRSAVIVTTVTSEAQIEVNGVNQRGGSGARETARTMALAQAESGVPRLASTSARRGGAGVSGQPATKTSENSIVAVSLTPATIGADGVSIS